MTPAEWRTKFQNEFGYPLNLEDDELVKSLEDAKAFYSRSTEDNILDFLDGRHVAKWMSMW